MHRFAGCPLVVASCGVAQVMYESHDSEVFDTAAALGGKDFRALAQIVTTGMFDLADSNGDKLLSIEEFKAKFKPKGKTQLEELRENPRYFNFFKVSFWSCPHRLQHSTRPQTHVETHTAATDASSAPHHDHCRRLPPQMKAMRADLPEGALRFKMKGANLSEEEQDLHVSVLYVKVRFTACAACRCAGHAVDRCVSGARV